jgi:hypothetical protein
LPHASQEGSPQASQLGWRTASEPEIIDNDNLSQVMDEINSPRTSRSSLLYSIEGPGKTFRVSSPDATCSLSFTANAKSLFASSYVQMELPADELVKLSGPAVIRGDSIHGDSLEVTLFNGTDWHVSEVAVALTIVKRGEFSGAWLPAPANDGRTNDRRTNDGLAKIVPASAIEPVQDSEHRLNNGTEKRPDIAILYHMRAAAAPFGVTVFATPLKMDISANQEWHWAIVQAKGYPPRQSIPGQTARGTAANSLQPPLVRPETVQPEALPSTTPATPRNPEGLQVNPSPSSASSSSPAPSNSPQATEDAPVR